MRCPRCGAVLQGDLLFCPYDGSRLTDTPVRDPRIGTTVNKRYHILERVRSGATATVYRARHRTLPGEIALKVLHVTDDRHVARFAREARAASRIDHENVVSVIDFGYADEGFYFLAMEYVSGRLLEEEIERSAPMAPIRVAKLLGQIGGAVSRAHQLGIIHRDLKPDNVMLCVRDGDPDFVKVLDFGLARPIEPTSDLPGVTHHGEVLGTPQYMAPEQWLGAPTDERTDIYALGVLAYELVTGAQPFRGGLLELMHAHLHTPPMAPSELLRDANMPAELDELVLRALAKDPSERFGSVEQMLAALGTVCASITGRRTHLLTRTRTRSPRPLELDPTQLDVDTLDVADAPAMCAEIRRLGSVRRHRLWQLVDTLWKQNPPFEVQLGRRQLATLEALLEDRGRALTALVSRIEEQNEATRKAEAELRGRIVDISLAVAVERQMSLENRHPDLDGDDEEEPTIPTIPRSWSEDITNVDLSLEAGADLEAQLANAERELARLEGESARAHQIARQKIATAVAGFRRDLVKVQSAYEQLSDAIRRALQKHPDAKRAFAAFAEADGAVASYALALDSVLGPVSNDSASSG